KNEIEEMRKKFLSGGYGYGDAKKELLDKILFYFKDIRKKYFELKNNRDYVVSVLKNGAEKANATALKTMKEVLKAIGIE
ncbi:MAG TPA: tryptophan--tRNA ligase, partial [Spirochaetota bacterium]|nr:tryptophan--tRNA ligase [Spirochaetota bacterium]